MIALENMSDFRIGIFRDDMMYTYDFDDVIVQSRQAWQQLEAVQIRPTTGTET